MKKDRFLIGILVGIGVLITAALVVFFIRQGDGQTYVGENTPDGVVHNFVLALQKDDFQKAYGYLADEEDKPAFGDFRSFFFQQNTTVQKITVFKSLVGMKTWIIQPGLMLQLSRSARVRLAV